MVIEILGLLGYEIVTTVAGLAGLKVLSGGSVGKRMAGINQPKQLPIIDRYLRKQIGPMTKTERWASEKMAKAVNRMSHYQAFKYLSIIIARRIRESQLEKAPGRNTRTRRSSYWGLLVR